VRDCKSLEDLGDEDLVALVVSSTWDMCKEQLRAMYRVVTPLLGDIVEKEEVADVQEPDSMCKEQLRAMCPVVTPLLGDTVEKEEVADVQEPDSMDRRQPRAKVIPCVGRSGWCQRKLGLTSTSARRTFKWLVVPEMRRQSRLLLRHFYWPRKRRKKLAILKRR